MNGRIHRIVVAVALAALVVGISAAPAFAAAPTVVSVSPTSGPNTTPVTITFSGTGMDTATAAALHKAGQADIVGTSFVSDSAIQAHATFDITGAATGTWDVRVTNPEGNGVCTGCFTVRAANALNPSVSSATPNNRGQGSTGGVIVLAGSQFQSGSNVTFSNTGITVTNISFVSAAELDVTIDISGTALPGAGNITVNNPDGGSGGCTSCFTVNAKPSVLSSSPNTAPNTAPVTLTLTGTNFAADGSASLTKTGQAAITGSNWVRNTSSSLSIDFDIVDVAPGAWVINIVNSDGGPASCSSCFTITAAAPVASSASPSGAPQGTTNKNISIIGSNFFPGATVTFSGTGITVNSTTFVDSSHLTANISIDVSAATGMRDFTVTNTDTHAGTCTGCFRVTSPAVVTLAAPSSLTGPVVATFSRDVTGVTSGPTGNFVLGVTGSGTTLGGSLTCKDVSATTTSCAGSTVRSAVLTPTSPLVPGQHYTATVNPGSASTPITDSDGAAIAQTSLAFRGSLSDQESSPATSYAWRVVPTTRAWGGSYTTERYAGARASYTFTGTSLRWYTVFGPDQGTASVTIDGISYGTVNNYRATAVFGGYISFGALTAGTHTLQITVNGAKGSSAGTGTFISIDAMTPGTGALQKTPIVRYVWRIAPSSITSGGHFAISDQKGAAAYFTFRGTRIDWYIFLSSACGKAAVYIDGVFKGTVDTYRSTTTVGFARFSGLSDAVHTIKIVNLGTHSAASHGNNVTVDRFVVG